MSEELEVERGDIRDNGRRPPRAVVGSQRVEEEIFGRLFDRTVVSRIWDFVRPYRRQLIISVIAVLIFTATQIAIPLIEPLARLRWLSSYSRIETRFWTPFPHRT